MRKTAKFAPKYLDKLIGKATTDAYNELEQASGFFAIIEENLSLPFVTQVFGQSVTMAKLDIISSGTRFLLGTYPHFRSDSLLQL